MDLRVIRVADDAARCSNYQRLPRGPRMVAGNEVISTGNVLAVAAVVTMSVHFAKRRAAAIYDFEADPVNLEDLIGGASPRSRGALS